MPSPKKYILPGCFCRYDELIALQSTRNGGVSEGAFASLNLGRNTGDLTEKVHENTLRLCAAKGIDPRQLVTSDQVHGTAILSAEKPGHYHGYDALITDKKNLFLCIFTADCYPVIIYDPRNMASAAVHAGWKGSAGEIVIKTIEAMQKRFNSLPAECLAYIGTGISPEAYEVERDVAMRFPSYCCQQSPNGEKNEKYLLDLGMVNYRQLLASGIPPSNIERSPYCSDRDSSLFFSYRRDQGITGRMVSLIGVNLQRQSAPH
jgi:polyphenol oxidase